MPDNIWDVIFHFDKPYKDVRVCWLQCDRLIYGEQKLVCIIQAYWSRNKRLLFWYIISKPVNPAIPLLIINTLDIDEDVLRLELGVDELFASHAVSDVRVDCMENTVDYSDQVSISWYIWREQSVSQSV